MLTQKVQTALNEQMNMEFFSANLYLSMSAWMDGNSLKGMAHWMRLQAEEEQEHGMKFFEFIQARGGNAEISAIEAPKTSWDSPLQVFEESWQHECKISELINNIADLTIHEKDFATQSFLQWFITEQVEEEATVLEIVERLKLVGDNGAALFMLEADLGKRAAAATTN